MSVKVDANIKQCAGECGTSLRPRGVPAKDAPGTLQDRGGWHCWRCRDALVDAGVDMEDMVSVAEQRGTEPHTRAVDEGWPLSSVAGFSGPNTAGRFTYWCKFCDFDGPARSEREARQYVYGHFFKFLPEGEKQ